MSRDDAMDIRAESLDEGRYNNAHRAFLQAFLSQSVMTVDEIKPVLAAVMSAKSEEPIVSHISTTYLSLFPDHSIISTNSTHLGIHIPSHATPLTFHRSRPRSSGRRYHSYRHNSHDPDHQPPPHTLRLRDPLRARSAHESAHIRSR